MVIGRRSGRRSSRLIRELKASDIPDVSAIHREALRHDLLPQLGVRFLAQLYTAMIRSRQAFGFVLERDGRVGGFVIGTTESSAMFGRVVRTAAPSLMLAALPPLLARPALGWRLAQAFLYPNRASGVAEEAELLVIALRPEYRGGGEGARLVAALNLEFAARGVTSYKVTVYDANERATGFYERLQFDRRGTFTLFGRLWRLYTYDLRQARG